MRKFLIIRVIVGTILPPALGSLFYSVGFALIDPDASWLMVLPVALFGLLLAYPIMILPSFIYSVIMERVMREKKENALAYYSAAGGLGWAASLILSIGALDDLGLMLFTFNSITGIAVGMTTAVILFRLDIANFESNVDNNSEPDVVGNA